MVSFSVISVSLLDRYGNFAFQLYCYYCFIIDCPNSFLRFGSLDLDPRCVDVPNLPSCFLGVAIESLWHPGWDRVRTPKILCLPGLPREWGSCYQYRYFFRQDFAAGMMVLRRCSRNNCQAKTSRHCMVFATDECVETKMPKMTTAAQFLEQTELPPFFSFFSVE